MNEMNERTVVLLCGCFGCMYVLIGISLNLSENERLVSAKNSLGLSENLVCFLSGWTLDVNSGCNEISLPRPSSLHIGSNSSQSWREKSNFDPNWAFGEATHGKWTPHWGIQGWGFEFAAPHHRWVMNAQTNVELWSHLLQTFRLVWKRICDAQM